MKKIILGTFESQPGAQTLIQYLRKDLHLPQDDISCICRDSRGEVFEVIDNEHEVGDDLTNEVKTGSLIGGSVGLIGGVAMLLGILPLLGPLFDGNAFVKMTGMLASAVGSMAVGGLVGAILGGISASFFEQEEQHEDDAHAVQVQEGSVHNERSESGVLVVAHALDEQSVGKAFAIYGARGVEIYTPTLS